MYAQRPRPGRRRLFTTLLAALLASTLLISPCTAKPHDMNLNARELSDSYASRGEIHVDTRVLSRRQSNVEDKAAIEGEDAKGVSSSDSGSGSASESSAASTTSESSSASTTSEPRSSSTTTEPPPRSTTPESDPSSATSKPSSSSTIDVSNQPLPSPFDTSIGTNFTTSSCPDFFNTFLSNDTFKSCVPISLLLQNSHAFMQSQRSPSLLLATLDAACKAPLSVCGPLMTDLASLLTSDDNCGSDFRARQPLVIQAYNGLVAYEPVATATCLKTTDYDSSSVSVSTDSKDGDAEYCFLSAVTNKGSSSDPAPYYTAVGMTLPAAASPSCNSCLKQAMRIFGDFAVRSEQPLSMTYMSGAEVVDNKCGNGFADLGVRVGSVEGEMRSTKPPENGKNSAGTIVTRPGWRLVLAGVMALAVLI